MNGIRASHSEWCKLDRQISYDIAYLKKGKQMNLWDRNRLTDIENKLTVKRG